jgi:hypothetical protein
VKELRGRASVTFPAPAPAALALLLDAEGYQRWYPEGVRSVRALERDAAGAPRRVAAVLHVSQGPLQRDLALTLRVEQPDERTVLLVREPHGPSDRERFTVTWLVADGGLSLSLEALLDVPRLLPLGGVGDSLARGFAAAAARALGE